MQGHTIVKKVRYKFIELKFVRL